MLNDQLYYPDSLDSQQWLIYYISRPLIGSYEQVKITPAILPEVVKNVGTLDDASPTPSKKLSDSGSSSTDKKDIKTFNGLLNNFPMIARQMQPGLEKVFKQFREEMQDQPKIPSNKDAVPLRRSSTSLSKSNGSIHSNHSNGHPTPPSSVNGGRVYEEDQMRRSLETAVTAAIDLFQQVDKQQLSFLGATTDLTGPMVERLIERYITEQLHDPILFPSVRSSREIEDSELDSCIRDMQHIDIAQVGITIENGRNGKDLLMNGLAKGVEEFRMLAVASSPQEMMEVLLKTQQLIASETDSQKNAKSRAAQNPASEESEKTVPTFTMNADTLVSLLLIVVIHSQVRHLQARSTYMRNFTFVDDVENGEIGYALSTFEAVLAYLVSDSGDLRKASRKNKRLWQATKNGDVEQIRSILEPASVESSKLSLRDKADQIAILDEEPDFTENVSVPKEQLRVSNKPSREILEEDGYNSEGSTLAHVFPFQTAVRPRSGKRVSMDMRSLSNASDYSFTSRTTTLDSRTSGIEGDVSIETLAQTQDTDGNSVLMMAIESRQPKALEYLLGLEEYFSPKEVMKDANKEGTTLLSAAVQLTHSELIEILLRSILQVREMTEIETYFSRPDSRGRTVAHYLFNAPYLIPRFWDILPWRKKDRNGQTPLLALCRSYDHPEYLDMVNDSLQFATDDQNDGQPLHLDDHVDGKGNTLLHIVNDTSLAIKILKYCDSDPNAINDKHFTPLMVASKYGRMDMVRVLFGDKRVDPLAKELRGMTAVELAKDDEIRNRIDDMVLVSNVPAADGRVTAVVRSFFVEDASIRLIIKSAVRNENGTIGVTTCRRSLTDFENLAKWLSLEHPASWLSSIFNFRSPFQIATRPSRAVLQDIQVRLDKFLSIMIAHSTFSTHELLWEFVLFPEIQPEMMGERSRKKAELRIDNIREEYEPIEDIRVVSTFTEHARDSIRGIDHSTKSVTRRVSSIRVGSSSEPPHFEVC